MHGTLGIGIPLLARSSTGRFKDMYSLACSWPAPSAPRGASHTHIHCLAPLGAPPSSVPRHWRSREAAKAALAQSASLSVSWQARPVPGTVCRCRPAQWMAMAPPLLGEWRLRQAEAQAGNPTRAPPQSVQSSPVGPHPGMGPTGPAPAALDGILSKGRRHAQLQPLWSRRHGDAAWSVSLGSPPPRVVLLACRRPGHSPAGHAWSSHCRPPRCTASASDAIK